MSHVDYEAYMRPAPEAVARLIASHGAEAAYERWHWMDPRVLSTLARQGRARLHGVSAIRTSVRRSWTDEDAAVAVEATHALGSGARGAMAAGLRAKPGAVDDIYARLRARNDQRQRWVDTVAEARFIQDRNGAGRAIGDPPEGRPGRPRRTPVDNDTRQIPHHRVGAAR